MKKQNLKELFKNKGVYVTLFLAAVMVVVALSMNKSSTGNGLGDNNLVDLNESPGIIEENGKGNQVADSSMGNDFLLEYDSYTGGQVANVTPLLPSQVQQAELTNPDDTKTQPVGGTAIVTTPPAEIKEDVKADNQGIQPDEIEPVASFTIADLKFQPEDKISWPVKGNVILNYSPDHGIYHATLKQFKTNSAVLISSEEGSEVKASAKGIITDIEMTPRIGVVITMAVGDDYSLVYGQLAETACEIGDVIEEGEVFATVGKATKYYSVEGEHLYFQVYNGTETEDPMLLLKDE